MPLASRAQTAAVHVRSCYRLCIGSQDITTMASFSRGVTVSTCPHPFLFYKTETTGLELVDGQRRSSTPHYDQAAAAAEKAT